MVKHENSSKSALFVGTRSAIINLLVLVLGTSVMMDGDCIGSYASDTYDWAMGSIEKYPGLVEDVQRFVTKEDISTGIEIILNVLGVISTVFLLCDLMMLSGVIMNSGYAKWLILPWICFNIIYNVFIFISPIFLASSISIYFFTWRLLILIAIVIAVFINKFIINWTAIEVVTKQFKEKKTGLRSWKTIAPDLTSDRVCLVSSIY